MDVVKEAESRQMGILALKSLAKQRRDNEEKGPWPKCWYQPVDNYIEAELALRFTLSQPVTAAVSPSHMELLEWACKAAENFKPHTEEEGLLLKEKSTGLKPIFPES